MIVKEKDLMDFIIEMDLNTQEAENVRVVIKRIKECDIILYENLVYTKMLENVTEKLYETIEYAIYEHLDRLSCDLVTTRIVYFLFDSLASKRIRYSKEVANV